MASARRDVLRDGGHRMSDTRRSLIAYLAATGWHGPARPEPRGDLWRHPEHRFAIAVPSVLDDTGPDWELLLDRLARLEMSTPELVEQRIRRQLIDVARLRAAKDL